MPRAFIYSPGSIAVDGIEDLQAQLDAKAPLVHDHTASQISDSTTVGRAVLKAADAAAARSALEIASSTFSGDYNDLTNKPTLGTAAAKNTGTTTGTVAAGDDSRITGAAQKSSNLSDLASASTARTNLGLGGAAVLAVGTTTGTVAAGDDSRITGAAQKSSNLSDLANAATARANLAISPKVLYDAYWDGTNSVWVFPSLPAGYTAYECHSEEYPSATDPLASVPNGSKWWPHPNASIYESV